MKWDDDRIDRDYVSLAKDHITDDCPLAEFLIKMKNKDIIDGHWRYFFKWLDREEDIEHFNQLKQRILHNEHDFFANTVRAGYLSVKNLHSFKVEVNNYVYF